MLYRASSLLRAAGLIFLGLLAAAGQIGARAQAGTRMRVMSANITSGSGQSYETAGIHIFQGLKPDVVAIQEFRYNSSSSSNDLRTLVNTAFGASYSFYCEPNYNIPNGIVSRWPIVAAGSWDDSFVSDRGFAWAQIDLPGTNDLYVVSVHLYGSGTATDRGNEAADIKNFIQSNFPVNAWVIVAGDFNTGSRGEAAVTTFKTFLSDTPVPDDNGNTADQDTNEPRNKPYDFVLPSFSLTNLLTPVVLPSHTLSNGLVFDSSVYTPLSDVAPVVSGDSHTTGMQHMAVIKDFLIPNTGSDTNPPSISAQPQSRTVPVGSNVLFSVTAAGAPPLSYQWYFNTNTLIPGATANSLVITNAQLTNAGTYSVIITNTAGSITSSVAALTVTNAAPTITTQPQNQSVVSGASATFSVSATGTAPLSYQWYFNTNNLISDAVASSLTITNAQLTNAGMYSVVVSNLVGSITSAVATLTVNNIASGTNVLLAAWDVSGQSGYGVSPLAPTLNASSVTVGGWTRGTGITTGGTAAGRAWGGNSFDASTSTAAVNAGDYATCSISVNAGVTVSFASIGKFDYRRSSSGPANGLLQFQVGAGPFIDVTNLSYSVTASSGASLNAIDLSRFPTLQNLSPSNVVTFRIVNYGASSSGGNWYIYDVAGSSAPDFTIEGIINPISTPNSPVVLASPTVLPGNQFQFTVTGAAGSNYVVQVSTNLSGTNWVSLFTNTSPFTFTDSNASILPQGFYRAVLLP